MISSNALIPFEVRSKYKSIFHNFDLLNLNDTSAGVQLENNYLPCKKCDNNNQL